MKKSILSFMIFFHLTPLLFQGEGSGVRSVFGGTEAFSQTISYIIPDIGTSGQNTHIEIIGPYNQNNNFGALGDGIYSNNPGDNVRVVCANNADTNKIKIGPVVVGWSGKMISTQVFVMPGLNPNSTNWQQLSPAYRIPLQVVLNGSNFSNTDTFYIVQPQPAIATSGAGVLGSGGAFGIRSRRGAMIVDDLVLNNGANVTVSKTDCDPFTPGNQGFLPIHVISRKTVFIDNEVSVSVNAPGGQNTDGAAGGGGGGTESYTNCSPCAGGTNHSGDGYTGGGTELLCGEAPGAGTGSIPAACAPGYGGISLNGVPGGHGWTSCGTDQGGGGGGTGHPFGSSGGRDGEPGGYGGGSGYSGYGGGGYASDGTTPGTVEYGKANGNSQLTPFAGGSGGGAGVAGSGTNRGGGGGGGGAITFHAYLSSALITSGNISANGGNGVIGCGGYRGGGGGSGGAIALTGKLNSQGTGTISVSGGAGGVGGPGPGGAGGAGRFRIDGPFATSPAISPLPGLNSATSYVGTSTDTSHYVARSFALTGTGNGQAIRIYLKPITQPWQLLSTVSGYGTAWTKTIVLPCPDTMFLIVTAQEVPSPSVTQYTAEPVWVFSQAAANILIVKNALKAHAGSDVSICPATCTTIGGSPSATGGVPPYTYQWAPVTGLNNPLLANPTACLSNNFSYQLRVTDSSGCFNIDSVKITMYPKPLAKFRFTNVCLNQTMNFHDSSTVSSGSITSRSWNFGDSSPLGTTANSSHAYTNYGTYPVTLIVTSNNGCKDTITKSVVVHPLPNVQYNTVNVCDGATVQFTDLSTIPATDTIQYWSWNFGDGSPFGTSPNISHLYAAAGSYSVKLVVVSTFGCMDSMTQTSIVHPNPICNFNNTSVCNGSATQFTDISTTASGSIATWTWDFGDGSPWNTAPSTSYTYVNAGNYIVTLIVNNSFGCGDTITKSVQVYYNPIAGFTHNDVCLRDSMHFTNTSSVDPSTSIAGYLWTFGDGSPTSNLKNPSHYYSAYGTYYATLVITTVDGCSDTAIIAVKTFDPPTTTFTFNNTCLANSAVFTNTTIGPIMGSIAAWSWNFGDGSPVNTTVWSPSHLYPAHGNYPVTLITQSSNLACPDTMQAVITVFLMPVSNFGFTNVCLNQPMNFNDSSTVSSGSIASWSWNFGDATPLLTIQNPGHTYTSPGTYTISLIVTTNNGCTKTVVKSVVVHPLPSAQFSRVNVCDGTPVQFTDLSGIANPDVIQFRIWNLGNNSPPITLTGFQTLSGVLYAAAGSYTVKLLVISNFGCRDSVSKVSIVHPNPLVNFKTPDTVRCEPLCISFQNLSSIATGNNAQWLWSFGDGSPTSNLQSDVLHCYTNDSVFSPLSFTPTLTVTSDSGCVTTKLKSNYITVYPNPNAIFSVQPQTTNSSNPVISIFDLSAGANFWNWNFGDHDTTSKHKPPPHTYADTGTYTITLITSTLYNCADTAYQTIVVEPDFMFYIPNSFSPNDDGINDSFTGKGIFIKEFEMSIYDRWGNLIFFTDDFNKPWDGKANHGSEIAQRDVYVYVVKVTDYNNKKHNYKGIVTLVR